MTAGRAYALVLEINMRRRAKCGLELVGAYERCAAICCVLLPDFFRNRNPYVCLVKLLVCTRLAEDGVQILALERLLGGRVEEGQGLVGHDSLNVEEMGGNLRFRKHEFFLFHNDIDLIF